MKHTQNFFTAIILSSLFTFAGHAEQLMVAQPLSDAQILGVMGTVNDDVINEGQAVLRRAHRQDVKDFATKMVAEHVAVNVKLKAVEVLSRINRQDSDLSKQLKASSDGVVNSLANAKDSDIDKTYIDNQVTMLQQLLTTLDSTLIPDAQNSDVKSFVQEARAAVESHLKEAQTIQSNLSKPFENY